VEYARGDPVNSGRLVVLVVGRNRLQVLGFEYLVAIEATEVIHAISPGENLGTAMITDVHMRKEIEPF
jgi:hypothetical protein